MTIRQKSITTSSAVKRMNVNTSLRKRPATTSWVDPTRSANIPSKKIPRWKTSSPSCRKTKTQWRLQLTNILSTSKKISIWPRLTTELGSNWEVSSSTFKDKSCFQIPTLFVSLIGLDSMTLALPPKSSLSWKRADRNLIASLSLKKDSSSAELNCPKRSPSRELLR